MRGLPCPENSLFSPQESFLCPLERRKMLRPHKKTTFPPNVRLPYGNYSSFISEATSLFIIHQRSAFIIHYSSAKRLHYSFDSLPQRPSAFCLPPRIRPHIVGTGVLDGPRHIPSPAHPSARLPPSGRERDRLRWKEPA